MSEFNNEVYENLKKEIRNLNPKLENVRDKGDFGTYRHLINAYRDVLQLIDRCECNIKLEEKIVYVDCYYLPNNKTRLILYKDNNQYMIDNSKYDLKSNDMVEFLSNYLNEQDIIYIDTHGIGMGVFDSLTELGYKVQKLNLVNVNT